MLFVVDRRPVNSDVMSLFINIIRHLIAPAVLLIAVSASCGAKSWRGIAPLVTTRAQALEMMGAPKLNASDQTESFDLPNEVVLIDWVRPTCGTQLQILKGEPLRPTDLVLQITVKPKAPLNIKTLNDTAKPTSTLDWEVNGVNHSWSFMNRRAGFGYSLADATHVSALYYFATDSEQTDWNAKHKSC